MSDFAACKTCGGYGWTDRHTCPPKWFAAPEDCQASIMTVYAHDAESAAEKAGERYDEDECYLARGNEMVFVVSRDDGRNEFIRVAVQGETVPSYSARELGPSPPTTMNDALHTDGEG